MMTAAPSRPVLRYHGGKWMLGPWIVAHLPAHRIYTEAYGGAASVLLRKPRARMVEVYNDLDAEIVNLFRVLRDGAQAAELRRLVTLTPYAREEFALSYEPTADPLEQARRTVVRSFQGFGSDSATGAQTGFRANGNRQNAHPSRDWTNYPAALESFTERLRGVVIENRPALEVIAQHDAPETLHYVDPPYPHDTRSANTIRSGKGYRHEMSADNHRALASALHQCEGMVVLSGYGCDLYDRELYPGWHRVERKALADGALDRVEVLWSNNAAHAGLTRSPDLFDAPTGASSPHTWRAA